MVHIRNMSEDLHRKMKSRAALAGMSLSEHLLSETRSSADRPTIEQYRARLATRAPVPTSESSVDIIREERDRL